MSGGLARLDVALVARGLVPTRSAARRSIAEGHVTVDGDVCTRPAHRVDAAVPIVVAETAVRYVGRGGHKLEAALDAFGLDLTDRTVVDVGSSTGGFTDCALQRGAARVVAVDVGSGQLHPDLLVDERVTSLEATDVRRLDPKAVGAPFDVVVVDVSFISLRKVAASLLALGGEDTDFVLLIKPQFEVGRSGLGRTGVVKSRDVAATAVDGVVKDLDLAGMCLNRLIESPVVGGAGNHEYLAWLRTDHNAETCHTMRRG